MRQAARRTLRPQSHGFSKSTLRRKTFSSRIEPLEPRLVLDSTVVFNEIMYNPAGADDGREWVELYNQMATDIDISQWAIRGGVDYNFAEGTIVPGKGYLVIAADPVALQTATGFADALGPFSGQLSNGGEELRLWNNDSRLMNVVDYGDSGSWVVGPDGSGATLAKSDQSTNSELAENWTTSFQIGGTPGAANFGQQVTPLPTFETLLTSGAATRVLVPDAAGDLTFNSLDWFDPAFDEMAAPDWFGATTGIGYGLDTAELGTNILAQMQGNNSSALSRIEFNVTDPADYDQLSLEIQYDDGFAAYLNGTEVLRRNAPAGTLAFNAQATKAAGLGANSPVLDSSLVLWLDASDLDGDGNQEGTGEAGLTGGQVDVWVDKSPSGYSNDATGSGTARPTYITGGAGIGNMPTLQFDGVNDLLSAAHSASLDIDSDSLTTFLVTRFVSTEQQQFLDKRNSGSPYVGYTFYFQGPDRLRSHFNVSSCCVDHIAVPSPAIADDDPHILTWEANRSSGVTTYSVDGGDLPTGPVTQGSATNNQPLLIGGDVFGNAHYNGDLAEILIYDRVLTSEEKNQVGAYLEGKYTIEAAYEGSAQSFFNETISLSQHVGELTAGTNVLAIHGLNVDANDNDFLIRPADLTARRPPQSPQLTSLPNLRINEVASATDSSFQIELVNLGTSEIQLGGFELVVTGATGGTHVFGNQTIPPGGLHPITDAQLGFTGVQGERIFLYTPNGENVVDARPVTDRLRGLAPNGQWLYPDRVTPGATNSFDFNNDIVINEIMYHHQPMIGSSSPTTVSTLIDINDNWRYRESVTGLPSGWDDISHVVGIDSWQSGPAPIGFETSALPIPLQTTLADPFTNTPYIVTYYFETDFTFNGDPLDSNIALNLNHLIDDGAVFYLNGNEVLRSNLPNGTINANTPAPVKVDNATLSSSLSIPPDALVVGPNRLSVEVHQNFTTGLSSDIVFGTSLKLIDSTVSSAPFQESAEEWIEFYNRGNTPVDLSGWSIRDAVDFDFPAGTQILPGQYLVVAKDAMTLSLKYPNIPIVGDYAGVLSNENDRILLRDAAKNPADEVHYYEGGRWPKLADGGGPSLELRDTEADNAQSAAWANSDEGANSVWQTYSFRQIARSDISNKPPWREFRLGLLDDGEFLIDDIRVVENPDSSATQFISNGSFEADVIGSTAADWRVIGNHQGTIVVDPDNPSNQVLHVVADGALGHLHDHAETTLANGRAVSTGREYEISFRAKWLGGSRKLNSRLYVDRVANTVILDAPTTNGTPGAQNSTIQANIGPTYTKFGHTPVLPSAAEDVFVSVQAQDPDSISSMTLWWSVNSGPWNSAPMTGSQVFTGVIPGQASSAVVQFYVEGQDGSGATSTFPEAGQDSRALIKVDDGHATNLLIDTVRIIMTASDTNELFSSTELMSNRFLGATIVHNDEVFYDVGARLKGTIYGRTGYAVSTLNYRIRLHPDQLFRGVHQNIALDASGRSNLGPNAKDEIISKHLMNHAGGIASHYADIVFAVGPRSDHHETAILQLARYNDIYFEEQFGTDGDGTAFELELTHFVTSTMDGTPSGLKTTNAFDWYGTDLKNLGGEKESYRTNVLIKNHRDRDDYERMVELAQAWSLSGSALDAALAGLMDIDGWMRQYAMHSLIMNNDVYSSTSQGSAPHNIFFYVHPGTGEVMGLPWDMDSSFVRPTTDPLHGHMNLSKIIDRPVNTRIFYGHMLDLIETTYNATYAGPIIDSLSALANQSFSGRSSLIQQRANYVTGQINARAPSVAFGITTADGLNVGTASTATITGTGWVNVREIRLTGSNHPLETSWRIGNGSSYANTWEVTVPVSAGTHKVTLEAYDYQGTLIDLDFIQVTSSTPNPVVDSLRITELNYNPADPTAAELASMPGLDNDQFEFIEVQNIGAQAINLLGTSFSDGVDFVFPNIQLSPGERGVVVRDTNAFKLRYGSGLNLLGQFNDGKLANGGENLALVDNQGQIILSFSYGDSDPWPERADRSGGTLEIIDATSTSVTEYGKYYHWRGSTDFGGSPDAAGTPPVGIVINEVLAHTDPPLSQTDSIELYNPTTAPIDISGWWLSDSADNLLKYQIPEASVLAAGEYLVFDADNFNPTPLTPSPNDFSLSGTDGDDVWLVISNGSGIVQSFVDDVHFGASPNGEPFGRVPNGSGRLQPLQATTLANTNADPRVGPLLISEVNYHPAIPSAAVLAIEPTLTDNDLEFIEVLNPTAQQVDLTNWRIRGDVDYDFTAGTTIKAGRTLVIVSFNPNGAGNANRLAAFRENFGIDPAVPLVGGFQNQLSNGSGRVQLQRPDATPPEQPTLIPMLLEDEVLYDDLAPWSTAADGFGLSLHRTDTGSPGSDVTSWTARTPKPGQPDRRGDTDLDGDVDTSDLTNAIINFTSANGSGKTWSQGDTDGDGDVDTADLTTAIINFTSAMSGNSEHDANKAVVFVDPTTPAPTSAVNTATNEHSLSNTPHFASTKKSTQQSTVDDVNRSATQSTRFNARDSRIHLSLLDHAFDEFDGA